jgi:hypothetical protein
MLGGVQGIDPDRSATLHAPGGMAERPNARLLKSLGMQVPGGSNPSPSARFRSVGRTGRLVGRPVRREAAGQAMRLATRAGLCGCDGLPADPAPLPTVKR